MNAIPEQPEVDGPKVSIVAAQLNDYGTQAKRQRKFVAAEIALRRAVAMHPEIGLFWGNLGSILIDQNRYAEAEECLLKSIKLDVVNQRSLGNLALCATAQRRYEEGQKLYRQAHEKAPNTPTLQWNDCCAKLSFGHWKEGLEQYAWRTKALGANYFLKLPYPMWNGKDDLNGKTIFVQLEQGIGDRILLSRFVYHLKQKYPACSIKLLAHDRMNPLFYDFQEAGICDLLIERTPFPKCDYGVYAGDLMKVFNTRPNEILADPGLILKRCARDADQIGENFPLPRLPSLKVGICWDGNHNQDRNHERKIPLELILRLAEIPKVTLYNLQAGDGAADIPRLGAEGILHSDEGFAPGELMGAGLNLVGSAMLNLNLVITACTSIAHLSGALNIPTWTLLCRNPYWIWGLEGDTTAWYPSMTLFRQPSPGAWEPVITEVKARLEQEAERLLPTEESIHG